MPRAKACEIKEGLGSSLHRPAALGDGVLGMAIGEPRGPSEVACSCHDQPARCPHCTQALPTSPRGRQGRGMNAGVDCWVGDGSPVSHLHLEV